MNTFMFIEDRTVGFMIEIEIHAKQYFMYNVSRETLYQGIL